MKSTFCDAVEALLRSKPGEWFDGREIGTVGGVYAWRSRISELRTKRGLNIENRQRRVASRGRVFVISEYRLVEPKAAVA
jgi:hypothetical protein